jgi:small subunit ribosomal protein S1
MTESQLETRSSLEAQPAQWIALIEKDYAYKRLERGQVCEGTILAIQEDMLIVDLGSKRDGMVPLRDLHRVQDAYRRGLQVGDKIPVSIVDTSYNRDHVLVSLSRGLAQQDWLRAQDLLERGEICQADIVQVNRGGVLAQFGRIRGFVPNSHLASIPRSLRGDRLQQAKSELVGQTLSLTVLEINQRRGRLVLSERIARRTMRDKLLEELIEGEVRTGTVHSLVGFGAFVDLGGLDGLIHISELDWRYVEHPCEVLSVGDEVEVYVLSVDRQRARIGLSRKRLLPDPWSTITESLREGQTVEGTVTRVVRYGAFVDVGEGVEGLVHNSEVADGIGTASDLEPGTLVQVRVLRVDDWRRRISLRLQQVVDTPSLQPCSEQALLPVVLPLGRQVAQQV